jgi:hypothetical protein
MGFNLFPTRKKRQTSILLTNDVEEMVTNQDLEVQSDQQALYIPDDNLADSQALEADVFDSGFNPTSGITQLGSIHNPIELPANLSIIDQEITDEMMVGVFQKFRSAAQIAVMLDQHDRKTKFFRITVCIPEIDGELLDCDQIQENLILFGGTKNSDGKIQENLEGVEVYKLKKNIYILKFLRDMSAARIHTYQGPSALSKIDLVRHEYFKNQQGEATNLAIALQSIDDSLDLLLRGETFTVDLLGKILEVVIPVRLDYKQVALLSKVRLFDVYLTILHYNETTEGAQVKFCLKSKRV